MPLFILSCVPPSISFCFCGFLRDLCGFAVKIIFFRPFSEKFPKIAKFKKNWEKRKKCLTYTYLDDIFIDYVASPTTFTNPCEAFPRVEGCVPLFLGNLTHYPRGLYLWHQKKLELRKNIPLERSKT
jgi:hypothetical protein